MRKRLSILALLGMFCLPQSGMALDIHQPQTRDLAEATIFFTQILNNTANPVIASMARESLQKLNTDQGQPTATPSRTLAEVTLLPQTDNTYVVPAMVNRKFMATFLVDTGASYTVITPQTADLLGIKITPDTEMVSVTTANGTVEAPIVTLKNVSLGGVVVNDVEAVITDLGSAPQLSGLLGMSFFQGMEIAFKQNRLIISR